MTAAAPPPVPPPVHEHGINGLPGHAVNMSLPRFHPIAMNPNQPIPPEHAMQNHHHHYYRPFPPPPPMQESGPSGPPGPPLVNLPL
ncbi:hypothetical protein V6Z93_003950 [Aspergillus fumigatus]